MATITFPDHPSPVADAEALRKAFQGWGTDERAIISIIGHRNSTQRKLIRQAYEDLYQEDLVKALESELSGHFETAVHRWMLDPHDCDAVILHDAIKKLPTLDYRVVVEFSCIRAPDEFLGIKRAYQIRYKRSLEEDLADRTTGTVRKFLVGLVSVYKYVGDEIDERLAKSEADILHNAITNRAFEDEEVVRIISTRSNNQVLATLNKFKNDHGSSLTKHMRDDGSTNYLSALRIALRCISDHHKYYEKVIRRALTKVGTDEDSLTRVTVTSAEKDLKEIKEAFFKRNSATLEHVVAKETSGDYKAFILTLLGDDQF